MSILSVASVYCGLCPLAQLSISTVRRKISGGQGKDVVVKKQMLQDKEKMLQDKEKMRREKDKML